MSAKQPHPRTHLFTVRLWVEPLGEGEEELRMQVRHLLSGETHYFREWSEVVAFLQTKMHSLADEKRIEVDISQH
jgi:hypothetical protein